MNERASFASLKFLHLLRVQLKVPGDSSYGGITYFIYSFDYPNLLAIRLGAVQLRDQWF